MIKMFSILFSHKYDRSDLLSSVLYNEKGFYKAFKKDLKRAKSNVVIESPYFTRRRVLEFALIFKKLNKKGVKVLIHTRHPRQHQEPLRSQAYESIKMLKNVGVKVKTHKDLRHRKLAVLDDSVLWEGSLNILSQSNSREIMRRSKSKALCRQMTKAAGLSRMRW